ncbi:putative Dolichyldiphosphatase [Blattamonas nauphoetae]|uniref:Dolichyldiphosphatase n=1 Tax=Blattamonas nauphoetae TaxID=2049346 RepID=A0ABQ9XX79_9EUKA|nr:putative Dolichyldiphosphatase [Blattamonas nauphoetae]
MEKGRFCQSCSFAFPTVNMTKTPFALTYILYDEGSLIGWLMALLSLCPIFIIVVWTFFALFESKHNRISNVVLLLGLLFNTGLNMILKPWFNEERPRDLVDQPFINFKPGNGFPSDHAQFMAFFSIHIFFWLKDRRDQLLSFTFFPLLISFEVGSLLVAYSRVYLKYHTLKQAVAGYGFGLVSGLLYLSVKPYAIKVARFLLTPMEQKEKQRPRNTPKNRR